MLRSLVKALTPLIAVLTLSTLASGQTPTDAQQQAIRSNCVSDYRSHCAEIPPHGTQALVCLHQHEADLSPACKSAVDAMGSADSQSSVVPKQPADRETTSRSASGTPSVPQKTSEDASAAPASGTNAAEIGSDTVQSTVPELTLRQELRLAAGACARDFRLFCPNLPVGHGNVLFCLKVNEPKLDPPCRDALQAAGARL